MTSTYLRPMLALALPCCLLLSAAPGHSTYAGIREARGKGNNPAVIPTDRLSESWWAERHAAVLDKVKANPDASLILLGDSITQNYEKADPPNSKDENFQPIWQEFYAPRKALNLGFSGDATQNVLWRLDHGEVDGLHPKAVVLLIGTNNTGHLKESAAETEAGIDAVVARLKRKLPDTRILLVGILPSGVAPAAVANNLEINRYLAAKYGPKTGTAGSAVDYIDIGSIFFKEGELNTGIYYDPRLPQPGPPLHPDTVGQKLMAEAIEPELSAILGDGGQAHLESLQDVNTALIPVPRLEMDSYDWYARHREELAMQRKINPEVVLVGDSITHFWDGPPKDKRVAGPNAWKEAFGGLRVLNMGFGWDRTQNVLWRLRQGEFEGIHPRSIVLNIGTNNLVPTDHARNNTPEEIVQGILAVHRVLRSRAPQARIIVMAIFPRGSLPTNELRAPIAKINELLAPALANEPNTEFLDIGKGFLAPDGTIPVSLMSDGTHPTDEGYAIWAKALIEAGIRK
jgi:lysophospholipase L1-like esterase